MVGIFSTAAMQAAVAALGERHVIRDCLLEGEVEAQRLVRVVQPAQKAPTEESSFGTKEPRSLCVAAASPANLAAGANSQTAIYNF